MKVKNEDNSAVASEKGMFYIYQFLITVNLIYVWRVQNTIILGMTVRVNTECHRIGDWETISVCEGKLCIPTHLILVYFKLEHKNQIRIENRRISEINPLSLWEVKMKVKFRLCTDIMWTKVIIFSLTKYHISYKTKLIWNKSPVLKVIWWDFYN